MYDSDDPKDCVVPNFGIKFSFFQIWFLISASTIIQKEKSLFYASMFHTESKNIQWLVLGFFFFWHVLPV